MERTEVRIDLILMSTVTMMVVMGQRTRKSASGLAATLPGDSDL